MPVWKSFVTMFGNNSDESLDEPRVGCGHEIRNFDLRVVVEEDTIAPLEHYLYARMSFSKTARTRKMWNSVHSARLLFFIPFVGTVNIRHIILHQ
jgi:hypothetical protein